MLGLACRGGPVSVGGCRPVSVAECAPTALTSRTLLCGDTECHEVAARDRGGSTTMLSFDGDVVIVTGAGGGMGRCHALELARRGARIVVNDLGGHPFGGGEDAGLAEAVVSEIRAEGG